MWRKGKILKLSTFIIFVVLIKSSFYFIPSNIDKSVSEIRIWKKGIKHAVWQHSEHFNHLSFNDWGYNEVWENLLSVFDSCNVVDIGANDGYTTLNLGGLSEIMRVKSHELMIMNYYPEGSL